MSQAIVDGQKNRFEAEKGSTIGRRSGGRRAEESFCGALKQLILHLEEMEKKHTSGRAKAYAQGAQHAYENVLELIDGSEA